MNLFVFEHEGTQFSFDPQAPLDISLPLAEGSANPNCYYAEAPRFDTIKSGNFVGSVAAGGACNYQKITLTPHGNGTHTESFGHISADPEAHLQNCLKKFLFFAQLITVSPRLTPDNDLIIDLEMIEPHLQNIKPNAIIIRTLPNTTDKKTQNYSGTNPPYFSPEIGTFLAKRDTKHLLVDLPSVDKEQDEGLLLMHKNFWQYPHQIRKDCTITELVFIDDCIKDGYFLLDLQVTSLVIDASPSKPILYALKHELT